MTRPSASRTARSTHWAILATVVALTLHATSDSITAADTAFLQALYSSDLERKLNIEQGEIRDRMVAVLEKH